MDRISDISILSTVPLENDYNIKVHGLCGIKDYKFLYREQKLDIKLSVRELNFYSYEPFSLSIRLNGVLYEYLKSENYIKNQNILRIKFNGFDNGSGIQEMYLSNEIKKNVVNFSKLNNASISTDVSCLRLEYNVYDTYSSNNFGFKIIV